MNNLIVEFKKESLIYSYLGLLGAVWFAGFCTMISSVDGYIHLGSNEQTIWCLLLIGIIFSARIFTNNKQKVGSVE